MQLMQFKGQLGGSLNYDHLRVEFIFSKKDTWRALTCGYDQKTTPSLSSMKLYLTPPSPNMQNCDNHKAWLPQEDVH